MSISAISAALKMSTEVKGARRWSMVILAEYADDDGYSYPKVSTIARRAAIDRDETIREALRWLEAEGYLERIVNGWAGVRGQIPEGKRPNLFRILIDSEGNPTGDGATRSAGTGAPQKPGSSGSPETGEQNRQSGSASGENPPAPQRGEDADSGRLFQQGAANGDVTRSSEVRHQNGDGQSLKAMLDAQFERWWSEYPRGRNGQKQAARDAWGKASKRRLSAGELDKRLGHYLKARGRYYEIWGKYPTLMHGSVFINSKSERYKAELTDDELPWPPPNGRSWDRLPVAAGNNIPAEVARDRAALARWLDQNEGAPNG